MYVAAHLLQPTRKLRTDSPLSFPYLVLHRTGFTKLSRSPGKLVRSYRTVSPLPVQIENQSVPAVCSLLHFPSRHRDSMLWSVLSCGVRTFLQVGYRPGDRLVRSNRNVTLFIYMVQNSTALGA
jgi:hypothetical protein